MDMRTVVSGIFEHATNVSKNGDLMTPDDNLEPVDDALKSTDIANHTDTLSQGASVGEGDGSGNTGDYEQQVVSVGEGDGSGNTGDYEQQVVSVGEGDGSGNTGDYEQQVVSVGEGDGSGNTGDYEQQVVSVGEGDGSGNTGDYEQQVVSVGEGDGSGNTGDYEQQVVSVGEGDGSGNTGDYEQQVVSVGEGDGSGNTGDYEQQVVSVGEGDGSGNTGDYEQQVVSVGEGDGSGNTGDYEQQVVSVGEGDGSGNTGDYEQQVVSVGEGDGSGNTGDYEQQVVSVGEGDGSGNTGDYEQQVVSVGEGDGSGNTGDYEQQVVSVGEGDGSGNTGDYEQQVVSVGEGDGSGNTGDYEQQVVSVGEGDGSGNTGDYEQQVVSVGEGDGSGNTGDYEQQVVSVGEGDGSGNTGDYEQQVVSVGEGDGSGNTGDYEQQVVSVGEGDGSGNTGDYEQQVVSVGEGDGSGNTGDYEQQVVSVGEGDGSGNTGDYEQQVVSVGEGDGSGNTGDYEQQVVSVGEGDGSGNTGDYEQQVVSVGEGDGSGNTGDYEQQVVSVGEGDGSGNTGDYEQQVASNVDIGFNDEDTEAGEGVKGGDEGTNGEELIGRGDAVEDSEGVDHDEGGEDTESSFDESDDSNGDTDEEDEEDEDVEYDDEDGDEESVNEVQVATDPDPQSKDTRLLTETRLTETEVIQNTNDQLGVSQNTPDGVGVSRFSERIGNPDVNNFSHPRLIKGRDSSQSLSDFDPDSYDYQNAVLESEHDLGDSWEWTFPNANISELDIPPELKVRRRSRMLMKFSRYKTLGANRDSSDQSVATQTEGSTPLSEFFSESDQKERFTVSSRNSAQPRDNNAVGYEMYSRSDRGKKKKPRRKGTADSLSDVVYFESPTTSRVLKTRLRYLYTDSNVGRTTSCTDGAAVNKRKVLNPLNDAHSKSETANILREFEQRNVVRTLSKLTNIEARFILTSKRKGVKKPAVGTTEDQDRQLGSSLSLAKSEYQGPLNSSLKLTSSMSERAPSLSDTLTERLIAWRLARGRAMSRPDVFRKSMAADELEKGVGDFLKSFGANSRKTEPLDKFRHAVRMTVLMLRAVGFKPEQPDEDKYNFLSWAVVYDEVLGISRLNYDSGSLTFDPLLYKAKKESTISPDVKEILRLPSNQRTDAKIHTVRVCFRQVAPSFSEFPIRIQESMIKVCTYEKFEPGRVIIRQGHRAENFYFIISGCAVVTEMDSSGNHVHTTNVLGKGNSFGELAFLNMSQRSATVTCREDVELICIEREDFIDIFMRGVKGKEAEHIAFLRTIDLLKGWPVDSIPHDNPKICAFTYVRRGVILCLDSGKSDWIFVIVSGTCKILKALNDGPVKQPGTHDIKLENPSVVRTISVAPASSNFSTIYTTNSTDLSNNGNNDINQEMASHGGAQVRVRRQGIVSQPRDIIRTSVNLLKDKREADGNNKTVSLTRSQHQAEIDDLYFKRHVLPSILDMKPQREAIFEGRSQNGSRKVSIQTLQLPPRAPIFQPKRQSYGLQPPALPQIVLTPMSSRHPKARKVFIEVARLESGDVFGLDQVVLGGMRHVTSCSLVSGGAEVVLINKKFFRKYLTEETLKTMRQKIRPLPSEKSLQNNLDTFKTWEKFKSHTLLEHAQWRQKLAAVPESLK